MRVVLDTNVLISGLFWKGPPRQIIDLAIAHKVEVIISSEILTELEAVLYEDFALPYEKIEEIIRDVLSYSYSVVATNVTIKGLRDLKDTKIIACALSLNADYIVTGDKDLLVIKEYKGIHIVSPKSFLGLFL